MAVPWATRALVVDGDPCSVAEYRQILCADVWFAQDGDRPIDFLERELLNGALRHERFPAVQVSSCGRGDEALDAVHDAIHAGRPFSVVFVDLALDGGLDGLRTAERIRALDGRTQIALVAGSSPFHPVDLVARVPPADRLSYLKKPFHPFELQQLVLSSQQRRRSDERDDARPALGGNHSEPADLREIVDAIPIGVLTFDRRNELVAANAEMRHCFADMVEAFVPGTPYEQIRNRIWAQGGAAQSEPAGDNHIRQIGDDRWALVLKGSTLNGLWHCLVCDVTDMMQRQIARGRAAHAKQLTRAFCMLCEVVLGTLTNSPTASLGTQQSLARLGAAARQRHLVARTVELGPFLRRAVRKLRRHLPADIGLEAVFDAELWPVRADPDALHLALTELFNNAGEAMPDGGRIVLEAVNVRLRAAATPVRAGLPAGDYVCITIRDSGSGLPPEFANLALTPFQTPKDRGRHFGIGLTIVHAFAVGSGGWLDVDAGMECGAAMHLYLPKQTNGAAAVAGTIGHGRTAASSGSE